MHEPTPPLLAPKATSSAPVHLMQALGAGCTPSLSGLTAATSWWCWTSATVLRTA